MGSSGDPSERGVPAVGEPIQRGCQIRNLSGDVHMGREVRRIISASRRGKSGSSKNVLKVRPEARTMTGTGRTQR